MRAYWADITSVITMLLLVAVFFARLFYPQPQLIVTPDYGRSDAWHFSLPTKYALSQSLATNTLPLWRNDIGGGFPLFSEGQTGALFLPNLILFKTLPITHAYNAALILAIATLGIGIYGLLRVLRYSSVASLLAGITLAFSGLSITQLTHITLLQGVSMLPFVVLLSILTVRTASRFWTGLLAIAISQQIYAGFPQASFMTLILSGIMVAAIALQTKRWQSAAYWIGAVILGIGGGAAQLLPSWEFLRASTSPAGFTPQTATAYSMPIVHIKTFLDPFALGNPRFGTYPPFYNFDGSIFWENTAFIGLLPLIIAGGSFLLIKKDKPLMLWWGILIASITLAAGKYAPTYILYSIWPMTLFRVPSRFLWITMIAVVVIAAHVVDRIRKKRAWKMSITILLMLLLIAHTLQLMGTWWSYHLVTPASAWMTPPETVARVQNGRVMTLGEGKVHNDVMTTKGWIDKGFYSFLRSGLSPDSNMLWGISQYDVYAGRFLKRPSITDSMLSDSIALSPAIATISSTTLMNIFPVSHILSYIPVDSAELTLVQSLSRGSTILRHYKNNGALPRAYVTYEATTAATLSQAAATITDSSFIPGKNVLLESHAVNTFPGLAERIATKTSIAAPKPATVTWQENRHESVILTVETQQPGFLVLTDTYYPGWRAYIDGKETPIFAANLSQRAIVLPEGTRTVRFSYAPESVIVGGRIAAVTLIVTILLMILPIGVRASRIQKKAHGHASHPPGTRRMQLTPS